ncbi:FadR/GntR family transcriptional regulator [Subtercola lobariae]|uniref:GntR C-terminal domain-containing protein n=1 Tax=Subtercola lobariae TaxID=1588641 RepID=A0A917B7V0_9MICO|nr:FCD domain-containing protein [Subtercola lobariae]GGF30563.1 hypothetical protein GCM10011399_24750 [Subtercola lobariae]
MPANRAEEAAAALQKLAAAAEDGERLGSKDELRELAAVSVGTFNEALKVAEARGVVTLRRGPGGGIFAAPTSSFVRMGNLMLGLEGDASTVADALRMRNALDPLIIGDALEHSSSADIADLRALIDELHLATERNDTAAFGHGLWRFQVRIAQISPNALLRTIFISLLEILDEHSVPRGTISFSDAEFRTQFAMYVRMTDAFAARDRQAAFGVMRDFLATQS